MALPTTYSELKTEIANWLNRSDLTDNMETFIGFAEAKINRLNNVYRQQATAAISMVIGQQYTDLPAGFLDNISLIYEDSANYLNPTQVSINELDKYKDNVNQGRPYYFAISSGQYIWSIKPDKAYDLTARYYKKWDIATDDTNWLLTNYPDVYLYTSLVEAGLFIEHPQTPSWQVRADEAIKEFQYSSSRAEKSNLGVDYSLRSNNYQDTFNIYRGY